MKILHIIDSGGLYGAEMVLLNLVAEQIKQGLKPIIASIGEKGIKEKPLEAEAMRRGFQIEKYRMRPGPNYIGALNLLRFAHCEDLNILHSHGYKGNILFGLIPKSIRKIPLLSTIHGWTSSGDGFSKIQLYEWLDRKSLKHIDAVVLVSDAMKSHPKLKGLKDINFHVIPNGIPIPENQFKSLTNQKLDKEILDFCSKGFTIGSVGRLSTEKGYHYLIEALRLLVNKGIDAQLIIIGEGVDRHSLESLAAELKLADRIMLPGYRKDAKQYIPFFNVFVISSLTEGLPISLLEAMQTEIPVVSTEVGGIKNVLNNGEAGLLVEPCNPLEISDAIVSLYYNQKLSDKLSAIAYNRVVNSYSSRTMAVGYLSLYNELA